LSPSSSLSLAEIAACFSIAGPIERKYSCANVSVKGRIGNLARA
jgi:hypothetical protein